jgi:NitT/TauT family transport system substrate-binding protein
MSVSRSFRSNRAAALFLLAAGGLALAACGKGTSTPPPVVDLKVGIVSYTSFAPLFIAKEEGYFSEQNLNVEFEMFENSTLIMPALEQGQLDAAGDAPVAGLFNAINQTGNIKIVADRGFADANGCNYMAILANADWAAAHPTPTAEDLRGVRVSVDQNTFQAYVVETFLGTVGLSLADVKAQYIPPPNLIEAAKNGSVDFISTAEPWVTRLLDTGKMVVYTSYQAVVPNMQSGFLNYGKRLAKDNPEIGNRFMIAYLKAVRQFNQGKTDRNVAIMAQYTKLAPDLLRRVCWPTMRGDGQVDLTTLMDYQNWAVGKGQLAKAAAEDLIWDPQFINNANKVLGAPAS